MAGEKELSFLEQYLAERDVPTWFRGTSSFQLQAADGLQNALRDDREQNTTQRTVTSLQVIGLTPLPSIRLLKEVMRLSRDNDLAFLYALLTVCYRTPETETYTINEQLLMSTICHLDMVTTLRELDRILPPGHAPEYLRERMKREDIKQSAYDRCVERGIAETQIIRELPYFQKLVQPVCKGKRKFHVNRHSCTTTEPYEDYKDPLYKVPNSDRWFAMYNLQSSRRIATKIILDELVNIFTDYDALLEKADNTEIICEKHFLEYMAGVQKKKERAVAEKLKCLDLIEMKKSQRMRRRGNLIRRLEHDIDNYQKQFHKERKEKRFRVKVISGDYQYEDKIIPVRKADPFFKVFRGEFFPGSPCSSEADRPPKQLKVKCQKPDRSGCGCKMPPPESVGKPTHVCGGCYTKPKIVYTRSSPACNPRLPGGCDCVVEPPVPAKKCCKRPRIIKSPSPTCKKILKARQKKRSLPKRKVKETDHFSHMDGSHTVQYPEERINIERSPKPSKIFFKAATEQYPCYFDFDRCFRFHSPDDLEHMVQKIFVRTLDPDCTVPREKDGVPNVLGSAEKCFHDMFKRGVMQKKREIERVEEAMHRDEVSGLNSQAEVILRRKYPQKYFDPEDKILMDNMLKDAFQLIKRNPYFVLAALPDAHKLPMIREWIYKRYGKRYTKEDRVQFFNDSMRFFNELCRRKLHLKLPTLHHANKTKFTYDDQACLVQQYEKMKKKAFGQLDDYIMKTSRDFWFAMRPYLLPKGPPRNTYFAYMPARIHDILHYRLWQPNEFIDYKKYWDQRRRMQLARL